MSSQRDFSTISPSARSLLLVKSQTSLPFARDAAELLWGAAYVEEARRKADETPGAAQRRSHFEIRARSVDDALREFGAPRVLELAAGLSFRGLTMASQADIFYLDTDLPAIATLKADMVGRLHPGPLIGKLSVRALDALDAEAFRAAVSDIPRGPLAIVHEGLLMYLNDDEKARFAASVRDALIERGGAWVTADVYVRSDTHLVRDEQTKKFLEEHRVEDNKFADFGAAEAYFDTNGFTITHRFSPSTDPWRVRETWVLAPRT